MKSTSTQSEAFVPWRFKSSLSYSKLTMSQDKAAISSVSETLWYINLLFVNSNKFDLCNMKVWALWHFHAVLSLSNHLACSLACIHLFFRWLKESCPDASYALNSDDIWTTWCSAVFDSTSIWLCPYIVLLFVGHFWMSPPKNTPHSTFKWSVCALGKKKKVRFFCLLSAWLRPLWLQGAHCFWCLFHTHTQLP